MSCTRSVLEFPIVLRVVLFVSWLTEMTQNPVFARDGNARRRPRAHRIHPAPRARARPPR